MNIKYLLRIAVASLILIVVLVAGCSKPEMVVRDGLSYLGNSKTPYSGKWTFEGLDSTRPSNEATRTGDKIELTYVEGMINGTSSSWNRNGQKIKELNYRDGKKDGISTEYYLNGQKWTMATFRNGELEGLFTVWYESGQKAFEGELRNGFNHGPKITWYENGQRYADENYRNGKLHGMQTYWYENGQKAAEIKAVAGGWDYKGQANIAEQFRYENGKTLRESLSRGISTEEFMEVFIAYAKQIEDNRPNFPTVGPTGSDD